MNSIILISVRSRRNAYSSGNEFTEKTKQDLRLKKTKVIKLSFRNHIILRSGSQSNLEMSEIVAPTVSFPIAVAGGLGAFRSTDLAGRFFYINSFIFTVSFIYGSLVLIRQTSFPGLSLFLARHTLLRSRRLLIGRGANEPAQRVGSQATRRR